jgi:hypothetical protein
MISNLPSPLKSATAIQALHTEARREDSRELLLAPSRNLTLAVLTIWLIVLAAALLLPK